MANKLIDYWTEQYAKNHGELAARLINGKSIGILHRCQKALRDDRALSWCIYEFHRIRHDDWLDQAGFSPAAFESRLPSLLKRYSREVREPEMAEEKRQTEEALQEIGSMPEVASLLDRIAK